MQETVRAGSLVLRDGFSGDTELPAIGYEALAGNRSSGFYEATDQLETLSSVVKRAQRYIYRDLTFDLNDLGLVLREYENRYNNPDLFYNVDSYLKARACYGFVW